MKHHKRDAQVAVAGVVCVVVLAACVSTGPHKQEVGPAGGTLHLDGLDITLPAGAVSKPTSARLSAINDTKHSLSEPITITGGRSLPTPWNQAARPVHISLTHRMSKSGTLTFRLSPRTSGPLVLLTRDSDKDQWHPVRSRFDPATGKLTANVSHFSDWAVLGWVKDRAAAVIRGVYDDLFGQLTASSAAPKCSHPPASVTARQTIGRDALGWCVDSLKGDKVTVRVTNRRHYPVDLITLGGGTAVAEDTGSTFAQLGKALTDVTTAGGRHLTLLPGNTAGSVTLTVKEGGTAEFGSAVDGEAYLFSVLDVALQTAAFVYGWLDRFGTPTEKVEAQLLDALTASACVHKAVTDLADIEKMTSADAVKIGKTASDCASSVFASSTVVALAGVLGLVAGLADALVQSVSGLIDTLTADAMHAIEVHRPAARSTALQLGVDGYGPLLFGMTLTQAEQALQSSITISDANGVDCRIGTTAVAPGLDLAIVGGRVLAGGVAGAPGDGPIQTTFGVKVGSPLSALQAALPGRLTHHPYPSDSGTTEYDYQPSSTQIARFWLDNATQRISGFVAGRLNSVAGSEYLCV